MWAQLDQFLECHSTGSVFFVALTTIKHICQIFVYIKTLLHCNSNLCHLWHFKDVIQGGQAGVYGCQHFVSLTCHQQDDQPTWITLSWVQSLYHIDLILVASATHSLCYRFLSTHNIFAIMCNWLYCQKWLVSGLQG